MKKLWLLLFASTLTACGVIPQAVSPRHCKAIITLKQVLSTQSLSHRWVAGDIYQYRIRLSVWNGISYVDLDQPIEVVLPQTSQAVFSQLKAGRKYRVSVLAEGNNGGTAPSMILNSQAPCSEEFDFTNGLLGDTLLKSVSVILDPMPFSSTMTIVPQNSPSATIAFNIELWKNGNLCYSDSYSSTKTMILSNLDTATNYSVILKALNNAGSLLGQASASFCFDPLEQNIPDQNLSLNF